MYRLFIHDDAAADLEALYRTNSVAVARIVALLQEIQDSQDYLDRLTQHDFGSYASESFHVSKWHEQWRQGRDLWRLKIWDLEDKGIQYRIVYALARGKQHYHVLGIVPRSFNYDSDSEITNRILKAYDDL